MIKLKDILLEAGRIPRKKGQKRNSKKHSDLYTDENPKGTIHGLKFATVKDAEASINKIKSSGRKHAHKVQAAVAMEQRAKAAGKKSAAAVYRKYINSVKKTEANLQEKLTQHVPEFFYHATYKALLPSIKRTGLDTRKVQLAWEDSKPGIVYLANDPAVAESYAEAADELPDEIYDSGIVILKVASKDLDLSKLHDDSNVQEDDSDTYEYHGQIPWSKLKMASLYEVDLHSKLSRGHKPDYYQLGTSEFKPFDKSRDDIEESQYGIPPSKLIDAWKKETSDSEIKYFCKRDNCGPAAIDFGNWAQSLGIKLKRVNGFFHADKVVSGKRDFTPEMKDEFLDQGGNFNNAKEREEWVENSKYSDQWKFIPHYWLEDNKGTVYDPVGQEQFIDMGYAKDLNKKRYTLTDEVNENFADGKKPGRKGISKRVGIPKGATLTQLAKLAKAKGEKGRMARWQLNMRRGKKKKKSS